MMIVHKEDKLDALRKATARSLGSNLVLWFKTSSFHWNVTGENFYEYHALFEKFYNSFHCAVDVFAEQLRGLGVYAPSSLGQTQDLSLVGGTQITDSGCRMMRELADDFAKYAEHLKYNIELATECGEHGLVNFLSERLDHIRKFQWFVAATLKDED